MKYMNQMEDIRGRVGYPEDLPENHRFQTNQRFIGGIKNQVQFSSLATRTPKYATWIIWRRCWNCDLSRSGFCEKERNDNSNGQRQAFALQPKPNSAE